MKRKSLAERFWTKVKKTDSCWLWTAYKDTHGYGYIGTGGRGEGLTRAHRASWIIHNGPIPDGLVVCHSCDNPTCVRPDHLFIGTQAANLKDGIKKGRVKPLRSHLTDAMIPRGQKHWNAKLTESAVAEIRSKFHGYRLQGLTFKQIGAMYGVSWAVIRYIIIDGGWKHVAISPNQVQTNILS